MFTQCAYDDTGMQNYYVTMHMRDGKYTTMDAACHYESRCMGTDMLFFLHTICI